MITALTIGGQPVDLGEVVADSVIVVHGRAAVTDGAVSMSATVTLLIPDMPAWTTGDSLTLDTQHGRLFTGTITDRILTGHMDTLERGRLGVLELTASGPLAQLGYRMVGTTPWAQETELARAGNILAAAGVSSDVQVPSTGTVYTVLARDVDAQPALDLLEELGKDTGAAVVDLPDGRVRYQPIRHRYRPPIMLQWDDFPPAMMWDDFDAATTWDDLGYRSPNSPEPLPIPATAILWEPQWVSATTSIVNHVRVGYGMPPSGGDQSFIESTDTPSHTRYGERYAYLGTQLASATDAQARVNHILATQAAERWAVESVDVWPELLPPDQVAALHGLTCGDHVQLDGLPQPAPAGVWVGICEGWTFSQWNSDGRPRTQFTLHMSDMTASLAVMTWNEYPAEYTWDQHPPLVTWADLTTTAVLGV